MKKAKVLLSVLVMLFLGVVTVKAQNEEVPPFAIGIRADPDGAGITAKYFFIPEVSAELMVNGSGGNYAANGPSVVVVGLVEYNFLFNDPAWRVFLGPGAHIGTWKEYIESNNPRQTVFGLDVIGGIEYVFYEVPIGISIDVKPAMNFISGVTSFPNNAFGLGIRYYFGSWSRKHLSVEKESQR